MSRITGCRNNKDASISVPSKWQKLPGWSSGGLQCLVYDPSMNVDSVCRKCHHKFFPSRYLQSEECFLQWLLLLRLSPSLIQLYANNCLHVQQNIIKTLKFWALSLLPSESNTPDPSLLLLFVCMSVIYSFPCYPIKVSSWSMQGYSIHGIIYVGKIKNCFK